MKLFPCALYDLGKPRAMSQPHLNPTSGNGRNIWQGRTCTIDQLLDLTSLFIYRITVCVPQLTETDWKEWVQINNVPIEALTTHTMEQIENLRCLLYEEHLVAWSPSNTMVSVSLDQTGLRTHPEVFVEVLPDAGTQREVERMEGMVLIVIAGTDLSSIDARCVQTEFEGGEDEEEYPWR